ncbi:MAG: hypothetical protein K940chlam6_01385, partial [Chlamydiae bacterium]|nr:hypothetical protein [Chlamydiota bacterium]
MNLVESFGKSVCDYFLPLIDNNSEAICNDSTSQMITAIGTLGIGLLGAKAIHSSYRSFRPIGSSLFESAKMGDFSGVKTWIQKGFDVNTIDSDSGETPLIAASGNGYTSIVRGLLKIANPDIGKISDGNTAMHIACAKNHSPVVQALIDGRADLNVKNNKEMTPLMVSIEANANGPFNVLVEARGISLNKQDIDGNTALHFAGEKNFDIFVRDLLNKGAGVNIENKKKELPLHAAASSGWLKNIQLLIPKTTDVNAREIKGKTPFFRAVEKFHEEGALELLKTANPDIPDEEKTYPIHVAAKGSDGDFSLALKLVQSKKVNFNVQDKKGNTPAHIAAEVGGESVLKALKEAGADFTIINEEGETPLGIALKKGKGVNILLQS